MSFDSAINRRRLCCAALLCCGGLLTGCESGQVPELRSWNPWVTKDWKADEAYAPTYHRKVKDLADLRDRAPSLPPEEQQRYSAELAVQLQKEEAVVMRTALVQTLAALPTEQARAAVQMAANDSDPYVRRQACVALGKNPDAKSLEILGQTLANDNDPDVRLVAAKGLGQFRDPQAAQALAVAIDDNNPALQHAAMDSLRTVTGKDYGYSASAWREYVQGGTPKAPPAPSLAQQFRENLWWW
ncbi:HEAT repeat domain-containing protein [Anatilimnocola sp. NA78]|uniref:HEAT repeat domain-containing protein n=1 Tax=Anatilimnocola sp. NA78 TaxID=3415683 RepID=UPI003CE48C7C